MENCTMKKIWRKAIKVSDMPANLGITLKYNEKQYALFYFKDREQWYATQNICPHKKQMVLGRGLIGDINNEPKVACPMHKNVFSLKSGKCLSGQDYQIETFETKIEDGYVYIHSPE